METVQAKDEAVRQRAQPMPLIAKFLAMLEQPAQAPARTPGRHTRSGVTKNHGQPRDRKRAKLARESRRINRGR